MTPAPRFAARLGVVALCAALVAAIATAAPTPLAQADFLGLRLDMSLAEVEAVLGRRIDVRNVRRLTLLTPKARRDRGNETYVRRLIASLTEDRTLNVQFVSPLSGAKVVEIALSQSPPGKPAKAILDDAVARFGPPANGVFRDNQTNLFAGWGGKADEQATITPLPGATVTLRLEVVHDNTASWTLFAHKLSTDDNAKLQAFR